MRGGALCAVGCKGQTSLTRGSIIQSKRGGGDENGRNALGVIRRVAARGGRAFVAVWRAIHIPTALDACRTHTNDHCCLSSLRGRWMLHWSSRDIHVGHQELM